MSPHKDINHSLYFMQDVELKEIELCQKKYMEFKINMHPIELLIVCKKFDIY